MNFLLYIFVFILGTIIGSFINVITLRLGEQRGPFGHSACFSCGHKLRIFELIPVVSFLAQGGRCRLCHSRISLQYLLVELVSGLIFLGVYSRFSSQAVTDYFSLAPHLIFFSLLLAITVYDLRHMIVPDVLSIPLIVVSFLGLFYFGSNVNLPNLYNFITGPMLALPIAALFFVSRGRWIGFGDAKLFLAAGWFLGLPVGVSAFLLSFWIGAAVSIAALFLFPKVHTKTPIPFGPFIFMGVFLAYLFNLDIVGIKELFLL